MADSRSWHTITVRVPDDLLKEALVGEFSADGISGVWERSLERGDLDVVLYFETSQMPPLAEARIRRTFERNGYDAPEVRVGVEGPADWSLEWRRGFSSFPIGERFRVVPSWEEPPPSDPRIPLRIDPGMAFGTGTHETTQTVIGMLEGLDVASPVLDWGTGSGILAIAAGKLGCGPVLACDIDPDAAFVAQSNFRRNRVAARLFVGSVDAVGSASIGLVLANLTPDVIGEGLEDLVRVLGPGGQAVLSGILADHTAPLETSLARAGLPIVSRVDRGEWISYLVSACGD